MSKLDRRDIEGARDSLIHLWALVVGARQDANWDELDHPRLGNVLVYLADMYGMGVDQFNAEIQGWRESTVRGWVITLYPDMAKMLREFTDQPWFPGWREREMRFWARHR